MNLPNNNSGTQQGALNPDGTTAGTNQAANSKLPDQLKNEPGKTPELNTGLKKPGEFNPGYDTATGLPKNGAQEAGNANTPKQQATPNNNSQPEQVTPNQGNVIENNVGPKWETNKSGNIADADVGPNAPKQEPPKKVIEKPKENPVDKAKQQIRHDLTHNVNGEKQATQQKQNNNTKRPGDHGDGTNNNDIMGEVKKFCGMDVPLRRGWYDDADETGFGYDKIKNKHKLPNPLMLMYVMDKYGNNNRVCTSVKKQGANGQRLVYTIPIEWFYNGEKTNEFNLIIVIDKSMQADGKIFGIVTAYPEFLPNMVGNHSNDEHLTVHNNYYTTFPQWFTLLCQTEMPLYLCGPEFM